MKLDSYWFALFQIAAIACFVVLVTWYQCLPLSRANEYQYLDPDIVRKASTATDSCFFINHGNVHFLDFPPIGENKIWFLSILLIMLVSSVLTIKPFLRFRRKK